MIARNERVDWHPMATGVGRFGEWLVNNIDWAISRDRYWGTPLPIWVCDMDPNHVDAVGGYGELQERVGKSLPTDFDPHKPHVDTYTWKCRVAGCVGTMRRAPEVIDAWFDSGSMPFAQWHYPFENQDRVAAEYPADFIAEGVDQTRGWFYSLLAIATGLGDALPNNSGGWAVADARSAKGGSDSRASRATEPPIAHRPSPIADRRETAHRPDTAPYRSVVVNDQVLDAEGLKMSKSRGNIVDPWGVIARHGIDAVRLFFVASSNVWVERRFDERVLAEQAGRFLRTFKNVYSGIFAQYANFGWSPSDQDPPVQARPLIDRWLVRRVVRLERAVDEALAQYDATTASRAIIAFVDDDLANWYVRLNRSRFYDVDDDDNRAAFATLHEALVTVSRLLAPIAPFVSDWVHRELTGESVHLVSFTRDRVVPDDEHLDRAMQAVRELARLGRAAREEAGIKVRQPLGRMVCVAADVPEDALLPLVPLLSSELNVKQVEFASSGDALVTLEARPNFRSLGKRFGKKTPLAAQAVAAFDGERLRSFLRGEPLVVSVDGESHELAAEDVTIVRRASGSLVVQEDGGFFAAIDPTVTPELRTEGYARELISRVQRMRKEAGLAVSDRIVLAVEDTPEVRAVVESHGDWIAAEVLAAELVVRDDLSSAEEHMHVVDLGGTTARVAITRIG
jgi:isoleucyl-tRNA synthetase